MPNLFNAHIFKDRQVGDREEVRLKIFGPDGEPLDLSNLGGGGSPDSDDPASNGLPAGGVTGQVLTKKFDDDYAAEWKTPAAGGSSDPLLRMRETFDTDLSAYVANASQGPATSLNGLVVSEGMMHSTDDHDHTFHAPGVVYNDGMQVIKVWPSSVALIGIMKYITPSRWLLLQFMPGANQLGMYYTTEDGINQVLTSNIGAPNWNQAPIYLTMITDGQNIHAMAHIVDPRTGARPYSSGEARIPDSVASRLCVPGNPGIRFSGYSGGYANPGVNSRLDEHICKLYRPDPEPVISDV